MTSQPSGYQGMKGVKDRERDMPSRLSTAIFAGADFSEAPAARRTDHNLFGLLIKSSTPATIERTESLMHSGTKLLLKRAIVTIALVCSTAWPGRSAAPSIGIIVVASASEAEKIIARLKTGADFEALAREASIDPTAHDGGHLQVEPEYLMAPLKNALVGIEPGTISAIAKIPEGFAILTRFKGTAPRPPLGPPPNTKVTLAVSGYTEFYQVLRNQVPKDPAAARAWEMDLKGVCAARQQAPQEAMAMLRDQLKTPEKLDPYHLAYTHYTLGELSSVVGDFDTSIKEWETVYQDAVASGIKELSTHMEQVLGIGYLHRASAGDHGPKPAVDSGLIFPSHAGSANVVMADVEKSIEHLTKALKLDPASLELKWLLNLAYMEAGAYPAKVPPEILIPPSVFQSQEDLGRFKDVGPATGLNVYGTAGGVIIDDFDGDGLLDVITSQVDDCAPLHFFHNNGDGTFTDRAKEAGLIDQTGGLNLIQADFNNDGCMDILVLRGGWEMGRRRSLLKNNCDGTFTDVTKKSGLLEGPVQPSQSAVWLDIDNDGNLDLFITNENAPGELFLNKGDGTFVDISSEARVDITVFGKAVVAGDYDNDGYPDLYISNFNGPDVLLHNNGDKTFSDVSQRAGLGLPWMSFASWFFDYDNDGWPDIFVTGYFFSIDEVVRSYLGLPHQGETLKLYRNMHDGTFKDVTEEVGLDRIFMPMGANFGDIDNDGFLDVYLGMGNPSLTTLMPNTLLHNKNGERFVDITASSGTGAFAKGHGIAFADLNNDGDEDLFVVMGGPAIGDRYNARLFQNPGAHGNDWITLKLNGVKTNRAAIGARIAVVVTNQGHRRTIYRTVGSGGSFGASPLEQHIGLGKSAKIESIEVYWPTSKTKQTFANVKSNQFLEIKEFEKAPAQLVRKSFRLGGL